jgi:hypothetical protein
MREQSSATARNVTPHSMSKRLIRRMVVTVPVLVMLKMFCDHVEGFAPVGKFPFRK